MNSENEQYNPTFSSELVGGDVTTYKELVLECEPNCDLDTAFYEAIKKAVGLWCRVILQRGDEQYIVDPDNFVETVEKL